MKRSFLVSALLVGLLLSCSEKCPLEPYRETCEDLYGALYPPDGATLPVRDLEVRTLSGSCGLKRDLSFCLPGFTGSGAGVIVATIRDTVPVMLGYVFPDRVAGQTGGDVPVVLGEELRSIVQDPSGGVRISAASTALGLIMLNPFLGGATVDERARFASLAARHAGFGELVADVCAALASSPEDLFDREVNPGLYEQATLMLSNLIDLEEPKLTYPSVEAPYVLDAAGDWIDLLNPTFVHYGVSVATEGGVMPDTVFLISGRDIVAPVGTGPVTVSEYLLGSGRFDIEFYKGFTGFSPARLLDPEHAGGLATLANAEQTLWYALTIPVGCAAPEDPGSMGIDDAGWVEGLAGAIEAEGTGKVLDLAMEYLCVNPDDLTGWLGQDIPDLMEAQHFLAAVRGILEANTACLEAANLALRLPFYSDLQAAVYHESLFVCQRDGVIVPCENAPVLTEGKVAPLFGHTDTVFTYSVHYYDHEGQAPSDRRVVIDGRSFVMELADGVPADGTYRYRTKLEAGLHSYYFECMDTHGDMGRLPTSGEFEGPVVGSYPMLERGCVKPEAGYTRDGFAYTVDYYDADGELPAYVRVVVDGDPVDMLLSSGQESDGTYAYTMTLGAGTHIYYFECVDPTGASARLPEAGGFDGPTVTYAPELSNGTVLPAAGSILTRFKFEVDYYDGDGDVPGHIRVFIDDLPGEEMLLKSGTSSDGTYCYETALSLGPHEYHFECTDTGGAETRLPDHGPLTGPMVFSPEGKNPDFKVAVHVRTHNAKAGCDYGTIADCGDIVTTAEGYSVDAFPVFFDLTEYQMVEYGLTWPGWWYSAAWFDCADATVGEIRLPGDGVIQTWGECRSEWAAVPGYVWLYADEAGIVCVCDHPGAGGIHLYDCSGGLDTPMMWFCAGVYGYTGDDPCPP